jgi:Spy/CpxP family protein refolding chaperone
MLNQSKKNFIHPNVGVQRSLEGEIMVLGKFTLAMFLLTAPAVWAQYSRTDMIKLASDRFDTTARTLNLTPDQVSAIKPLIQSKYVDMGQVKDVYRASDKSDASKKTAKESLKAIHDKYNAKITAILTPEQVKAWKRMQRDWKDDLIMPKS